MNTLEYLTRDAALFLPGVTAALIIAIMMGPLSVLVVLKRLAFVGHGVSHAAFGGVGLGLLLGVTMGLPITGSGALWLDAVTLVFAVAAAWAVASLTRRGRTGVDTAVGVVLAACMATGFVLHRVAGEQAGAAGRVGIPGLETVLFGGVLHIGWPDVALAAAAAAASLGVAALLYRPLTFWAFDETAALAHGVRVEAMRLVTLVLLAVAVIAAVKVAGVVLAAALLVMPGAIASHAVRRLGVASLAGAVALAAAASVVGVALGLVLSFESPSLGVDLPIGPAIVAVLALGYAASRLADR